MSRKSTTYAPILLIVVFVLIAAANFLPEDVLGIEENPYLAIVMIQLLTYAVPALFYSRIRGKDFTPKLRLRLFKPSQILYILYSTVFMLSGVLIISMVMYTLIPDTFEAASASGYAAFAMNGRFFDTAYLILTFAVLPAVCEEFLFRGIMIGEYESGGAGLAIVVSTIMFAMSHFSFARFPVYFFSGLVLGGVLYATRSLAASILIHLINNTVVLLCEDYVLHIVDKQNVSLVLFALILGAVFIVSGMLMCYEAQNIYRGYAEDNVESDYALREKRSIFGRISEAFFAPTFLCAVIIFVVMAIKDF
ncbi:MAG: CPBP family intramembrane metalloprotease [Ruminococcaceae bacterium]|nr:CPBP family intramembrane metalloprotease [Oscillospiraceae bacterium]